MRTTVQGVISGLHWGLGFGLGALLGGILYEHLGARLCFIVSSILPLFALMLLASPTARLWFSSTMTNSQRHWMVDNEYELAQTVSLTRRWRVWLNRRCSDIPVIEYGRYSARADGFRVQTLLRRCLVS